MKFFVGLFIFSLSLAVMAMSNNDFDPNYDIRSCVNPDTLDFAKVNCFNERQVIPTKSKEQKLKDIDYLHHDLEICSCLQKNPYYRSVVQTYVLKEETLSEKEESLREYQNKLETQRNAALGFVLKVSNSPNLLKAASSIGKIGSQQEEINKKLGVNVKKDAKQVTEAMILDRATPDEKCLPMHRYQEVYAFPAENEFWQDIKNMSEYKEADWNYDDVKLKFEESSQKLKVAQANKDKAAIKAYTLQKAQLKARMSFLYRTPMVRALFLSKWSKESEESKRALFDILKRNMSLDEECSKSESGCLFLFNKNNQAKLVEEAANLLKRPEVMNLIDQSMKERRLKELQDIRLGGEKLPKLTPRSAIQKMLVLTKVNISDCSGDSNEIIGKCTIAFAKYCPLLENHKKSFDPESAESDEVEKVALGSMSWDPRLNPHYQEKAREYCDNMRVSKKDNSIMNFQKFKNITCSREGSKKLCEDRLALFNKYMEEFSEPLLHSENSAERNALTNGSSFSHKRYSSEVYNEMERLYESDIEASEIISKSLAGNDSKNSEINPASDFVANDVVANSVQAPNAGESFPFQGTLPSLANDNIEGDSVISEARRNREKVLDEKEHLEEEIKAAQKQLASVREESQRSEFENRIRKLETQLAEKDKSVSDYQKMIDNLLKKDLESKVAAASPTVPTAKNISESFVERESDESSSSDSVASRGPASVAQGNFSTAGSQSGSQLASRRAIASTPANSKINDALLSKYGITISGGSEAGSILVAPEKDAKGLETLASKDASNLPLEVPLVQYEKFKSNDLETLTKIYEEKLKTLSGNVVKITVSTKGQKDSLEFYAIREGGKVVFQPIRKVKLGDLRLTLPKNQL